MWVEHAEDADPRLLDAIVAYANETNRDPEASAVVMQCAATPKGRSVEALMRRNNIPVDTVPKLDKAKDKLNYVYQQFQSRGRRIDPQAAQQLVNVLGDHVGELAAMIRQLCFDFDDDPMRVNRVNQYLTGNPKVTGFNVADLAMGGKTTACSDRPEIRARPRNGTDCTHRRARVANAQPRQSRGHSSRGHLENQGGGERMGAANGQRTSGRVDIAGHQRLHATTQPGRTNNARAAEATPYTHLRTP